MTTFRPAVPTKAFERELIDIGDELVIARLEKAGIALPKNRNFGVIFDKPEVIPAPSFDWAVFPAKQEPLVRSGKFFIPDEQRSILNAYSRAGVRETATYIAHEVPKGFDFRQLEDPDRMAAMVKPVIPTEYVKKADNLAGFADGLKQIIMPALAIGPIAAAVAIPASLGLAALLATAAVASVDPIIIIAVTKSGLANVGEPAIFFEVCRWDWEVSGDN